MVLCSQHWATPISTWRASEASETLSGVYKFKLVQYTTGMRYMCHNSSACHAYIMWAELGHSHILYVPAVSNVVTTGNGMGSKKIFKWNRALGFVSIQSSVYGATTVVKVSLFSTWTQPTVSFTLCKHRNRPLYVAVNKHQ